MHYRTGANTYASLAVCFGVEGPRRFNTTGTTENHFDHYVSGHAVLDDIASNLDSGLAVTCGFDMVGGGVPAGGHRPQKSAAISTISSTTVISTIPPS